MKIDCKSLYTNMENPEEIQLVLERYSRLKPAEIPEELEAYMNFVAKTGDTVFKWPLVQHLFREKLMNVITDFHDNSPSITELPHYPNVDPFNFELMKKNLIERMESFHSAPFTIQRICELLTAPRKQYSRIDKFMRAIEKNILVVSTTEPGRTRHESENGDSLDSGVNGDIMSEHNLDVGSSEEEQNVTTAETSNGNDTPEKPDTDTEDPLASVENTEIDIPLEKLEPEVNVLTIETNEPILKPVEETTDVLKVNEENIPDTVDSAQPLEVTSNEEPTTENVQETKEVTAETEPNPDVTESSPSKRLLDEKTEQLTDESQTKKAKLDEELGEEAQAEPSNVEITVEPKSNLTEPENPSEITPIIPSGVETIITQNIDTISETPESIKSIDEALLTSEIIDEVLPEPQTTLQLDTTSSSTATTTLIEVEQAENQPLPPVETIVPDTSMEQQVLVAATPDDENSMKVDAAPLINSENKMQTDEVDDTTSNAMDVDECSADFVME
uniref:CSON011064 protein n=1 Tax=Culicoides sonorensis TaxID=179676 RepID=A0A336LR45_CULSO